jgi:hypothetical protein
VWYDSFYGVSWDFFRDCKYSNNTSTAKKNAAPHINKRQSAFRGSFFKIDDLSSTPLNCQLGLDVDNLSFQPASDCKSDSTLDQLNATVVGDFSKGENNV